MDRDLQLRGGGGGDPDPEIREGGGSVKKNFRPFRPQFGLKIWGGGGVVPWIHHWIKHSKK